MFRPREIRHYLLMIKSLSFMSVIPFRSSVTVTDFWLFFKEQNSNMTLLFFLLLLSMLTIKQTFHMKNRLTCFNIQFQKGRVNYGLYTYSNDTKAQPDYILINKNCIISTLNCKVYSSFRNISNRYSVTVRNKFDALQEISETYSEW